jgi:hypothetical protein
MLAFITRKRLRAAISSRPLHDNNNNATFSTVAPIFRRGSFASQQLAAMRAEMMTDEIFLDFSPSCAGTIIGGPTSLLLGVSSEIFKSRLTLAASAAKPPSFRYPADSYRLFP